MHEDKRAKLLLVLRVMVAAMVAITAAVELGGTAATKVLVVTLTFLVVYSLFRAWFVGDRSGSSG